MPRTQHSIVVFQPTQTDVITATKSEKEIMYDRFASDSSIPPHHFATFMEMDMSMSADDAVKTNIPSIYLKKILSFCTPIISEIPSFTVRTKTVNLYSQSKGTKKKKVHENAKLSSPSETYVFSVSMQLERDIRCLWAPGGIADFDNATYMSIPAHQSFNIVGLFMPAVVDRIRDRSFLSYWHSLDPQDMLMSGKYGLMEFQSNTYTQSRFPQIRSRATVDTDKLSVITFKKDHVMEQLRGITTLIAYTRQLYDQSIAMLYDIQPKLKHTDIVVLKQPPPDKKYNNVLKQFAAMSGWALSNSSLSNDFIFYTNHILDDVKKALLLGPSNPVTQKIMQCTTRQTQIDRDISAFNAERFRKKLEYAKRQAIAYNKFDVSISALTPKQKHIVQLEFDKLERYYEAMKTPINDFNVVERLGWAIDNGKTRLIEERLSDVSALVTSTKNLEKEQALLKNKSNVPIVCPHTIYRAKKMIATYKNEIQKSGMIRQDLIDNFSLPETYSGHFCRICGEILADSDSEEIAKYVAGKRVTFMHDIDPLKNQIWKNVAYAITGFVRFKNPVNVKNIITGITEALRPEMGTIEIALSKIKSNSKDSIADLMSIYIFTYAMAVIAHMIIKNYGKITFSIRPRVGGSPYIDGGKADKKHTILQNVINNALFIVMRAKNIVINNVMSISNDSIKPLLIKAYKWATTLQTTEHPATEGLETGVPSFQTDSIYHYIKHWVILNKGGSPTIKDVLGRSWPTILEESRQDPPVSIYHTSAQPTDKLPNYKMDSFNYVMGYTKQKLYNLYAVPYSSILTEYEESFKHLKIEQAKIHNTTAFAALRPFNNIPIVNKFMIRDNDFTHKNIHIENYYDNNGLPHTFDIYVYQKGSKGPRTELRVGDINAWLNDGDHKKAAAFAASTLVDYKCSTCKVLMSQVKNRTIDKQLTRRDDIDAFFAYYENVCPKGELHDFLITISKKENCCKKCNLTKQKYDDLSITYYNKFKAGYDKVLKEKFVLEKSAIDELRDIRRVAQPKPKFGVLKINNAPMLELSKTFVVPYNIWINMGLGPGMDYTLIEREKANPSASVTPERAKLRNATLFGYYMLLVKEYATVRYHANIDNIPYDLKQILSKNKVADLPTKIPQLENIVIQQYHYYNENSHPLAVSNYMLGALSIAILTIFKNMKKAGMTVANDITMYLIKTLLHVEKITSKPDMNKFKSSMVSDIDYDADFGEGLFNDVGDSDDDDDADPDDPFSLNDLDIEQDLDSIGNVGDW
jgi:hypothetical protein